MTQAAASQAATPAAYTLQVDTGALNVILLGLSELPYKQVWAVMTGIHNTVAEQNFAHEQKRIQDTVREVRPQLEAAGVKVVEAAPQVVDMTPEALAALAAEQGLKVETIEPAPAAEVSAA